MTPMTLRELVIEMKGLKTSAIISDNCGRIRRLTKSGVAMKANAR